MPDHVPRHCSGSFRTSALPPLRCILGTPISVLTLHPPSAHSPTHDPSDYPPAPPVHLFRSGARWWWRWWCVCVGGGGGGVHTLDPFTSPCFTFSGLTFAYRDSNSPADAKLVPLSGRSLNCTDIDCALGHTLQQIYRNKTGLASFLYNDEPPGTRRRRRQQQQQQPTDNADTALLTVWPSRAVETAHAKGVLAYDGADAGFWLIHSMPKFPDIQLPSFSWTPSTTYVRQNVGSDSGCVIL